MSDLIKDLSIPLFTGVIGYVTNWSGIWMLFNPLRFKGFRIPGLAPSTRSCRARSSRSRG